MAIGRGGAVLRQVDRLFGAGTVAGLGESQLIERFVSRGDAVAFEALVARHGPMVLGVCRRLLSDPHDVEDAFQATFVVLVRRAGTIRAGEPVGNWLYGVARKVAARARADAGKRRRREGGPAEAIDAAGAESGEIDRLDLRGTLDEEIARLPESYRRAVVLCYLEGLTHDEAARQLGWPVGTVRGRLARARDLLRSRLVRRGVAPAAILFAAGKPCPVGASAVPAVLSESTIRAASRVAAGRAMVAGAVSARVAALTEGVMRTMFLMKLKTAAVLALTAGAVAVGAGVYARQDAPSAGTPAPDQAPVAAAAPAPEPAPTAALPTAEAPPAAGTSSASLPPPQALNPPAPAATPGGAAPDPGNYPSAPKITTQSVPVPGSQITTQPVPAPAQPAALPGTRGAAPTTVAPPPALPGMQPRPGALPAAANPTAPVPETPNMRPNPLSPYVRQVGESRTDIRSYLNKTRGEVDAAIQALTEENEQLQARLREVQADLEVLKALKQAFSNGPHSVGPPTRSGSVQRMSAVETVPPTPSPEALDTLAPTPTEPPASVTPLSPSTSVPDPSPSPTAEPALVPTPTPVSSARSAEDRMQDVEARLTQILGSIQELRTELGALRGPQNPPPAVREAR